MFIKTQNYVYMYILRTQTRTVTCYMTHPSTQHDKQNRNCLDYSQNLVMSPGGTQRQDGLTD